MTPLAWACVLLWHSTFAQPTVQYAQAQAEVRVSVCKQADLYRVVIEQRLFEDVHEGKKLVEHVIAPWSNAVMPYYWRRTDNDLPATNKDTRECSDTEPTHCPEHDATPSQDK